MRKPFADVRGDDVIDVVGGSAGVTAVEIEAMREAGDAFEFDASRADLSILMFVEARVGDEDVGLVDLEDSLAVGRFS